MLTSVDCWPKEFNIPIYVVLIWSVDTERRSLNVILNLNTENDSFPLLCVPFVLNFNVCGNHNLLILIQNFLKTAQYKNVTFLYKTISFANPKARNRLKLINSALRSASPIGNRIPQILHQRLLDGRLELLLHVTRQQRPNALQKHVLHLFRQHVVVFFPEFTPVISVARGFTSVGVDADETRLQEVRVCSHVELTTLQPNRLCVETAKIEKKWLETSAA